MASIIAALLFGLGYYRFGLKKPGEYREARVSIRGSVFTVQIAETLAAQAQGLSGRAELAENEGMLFLFPAPSPRVFWMKEMLIPIDIIWIADGKIVGFAERAEPEPGKSIFGLKQYESPRAVETVLEVPAGTVSRHGFTAGDEVAILL